MSLDGADRVAEKIIASLDNGAVDGVEISADLQSFCSGLEIARITNAVYRLAACRAMEIIITAVRPEPQEAYKLTVRRAQVV